MASREERERPSGTRKVHYSRLLSFARAGRRLTTAGSVLALSKWTQKKSQFKSTYAQEAAEKAARRKEQGANVRRKKDEVAAKKALKTSSEASERSPPPITRPTTRAKIVHDYDGEDEFEFEDRIASN